MRGQGRGRSPRCPKIPERCALTGAAMPLKWVVSAKRPYQFFIPEKMAHGAEIAEESAPTLPFLSSSRCFV